MAAVEEYLKRKGNENARGQEGWSAVSTPADEDTITNQGQPPVAGDVQPDVRMEAELPDVSRQVQPGSNGGDAMPSTRMVCCTRNSQYTKSNQSLVYSVEISYADARSLPQIVGQYALGARRR
jgi:hypothetical protein